MLKSEKSNANHTSLDTIETSAHLKSSYRYHLLKFHKTDYARILKAYSHLDRFSTKAKSEILQNCRSFAYFAVNRETRKVSVISNSCRLRWCPMCASVKRYTIAKSVKEFFIDHPKCKLLTLTLKHSNAPLVNQINHLYQSFRSFRRLKPFIKAVKGGIWFFQITYSKASGQWHPHLHCVIESNYIAQSWLSENWQRITHGSPIVDIRTVFDYEKAVNYVARYASKPIKIDSLTDFQLIEVMSVMHGRRLAGTWGSAKNVNLTGKTTFNRSDYVMICGFKKAFSFKEDDRFLETIFNCWKKNEPLPDSFNIYCSYYKNRGSPDLPFEDLSIEDYYNGQ